ncbi:MAG TPA: hypothetical protein IAD32_07985 [Candidatus Scatavimonas merdigallinarum]|uniref:Uncharacterized protein n=1 Tax=Candidatus Scatavimonas merdigallinarum TaxID=2840914 RepID=A0A9D1CUR4_9FIRM|nr:hypothetical protein [Candidatus Scatavimonas merdigallinarum]
MNFKEVYERFLLIADMDQEEGSKWAVLCNEAIEDIQNMCKSGTDIQLNGRRLSAAAAALAFYKMALMQNAAEDVSSFKAGDISIQMGSRCTKAQQAWLCAKAHISDLIRDEDFLFEQVTI